MKSPKENLDISKAFLKLRNEAEISKFLKDIMSDSEINNLEVRWKILNLLNQNYTYLDIERLTGASSATIAKINQSLKNGEGSFQIIFNRMR